MKFEDLKAQLVEFYGKGEILTEMDVAGGKSVTFMPTVDETLIYINLAYKKGLFNTDSLEIQYVHLPLKIEMKK